MTLSISNLREQDGLFILLFLLGIVFLNWPFLSLVESSQVFGYPLILVYLVLIWLVIIVLMFLNEWGTSD